MTMFWLTTGFFLFTIPLSLMVAYLGVIDILALHNRRLGEILSLLDEEIRRQRDAQRVERRRVVRSYRDINRAIRECEHSNM